MQLIFEPYAADLAARLSSRPPSSVLEIAAGTAVCGGTLRELLLGRRPVFWIADAALTLLYARVRAPPRNSRAVAAAVGLVVLQESLPRL